MIQQFTAMLKKNTYAVSHFPSGVQNTDVTKEKKMCLFRLQVPFMFMHPLWYLQAKYFNITLKHENMETELLVLVLE